MASKTAASSATTAEAAKKALETGSKQFLTNSKGEFIRKDSSFRNVISSEPGSQFTPEADRYHLYVSLACPWAHRTLIVRELKKLQSLISVSVVDYLMLEGGWRFAAPEEGKPATTPDHVYGSKYLRELYFKADPDYSGRYTVPVLWDKKLHTIVNNESSEIIRMFNNAFDDLIPQDVRGLTFYPEHLRKEIDELNDWVYHTVNNGVYKSGFASTQTAYEENCVKVFSSLDRLEALLAGGKKYLVADTLTEADIRLFTTVVRFDPVYHGHFKCNMKSIGHDYPNLLKWARRIYQIPGVAGTVDMHHIKCHYYMSHYQINPTGVVPLGNGPDLSSPTIA